MKAAFINADKESGLKKFRKGLRSPQKVEKYTRINSSYLCFHLTQISLLLSDRGVYLAVLKSFDL